MEVDAVDDEELVDVERAEDVKLDVAKVDTVELEEAWLDWVAVLANILLEESEEAVRKPVDTLAEMPAEEDGKVVWRLELGPDSLALEIILAWVAKVVLENVACVTVESVEDALMVAKVRVELDSIVFDC